MDTSKRALPWSSPRNGTVTAAPATALSPRIVTWLLGLGLGLAVSWQVLREPGVVGFVHDWSIAPFAEQHLALLRQTFDGWYRFGLGAPAAYPLEYPLRIVLGAAAAAGLGGDVLSKSLVLLVPAMAFVAAAYLGRTCGLPFAAAWLCGAFYALDPVMLNKLVSGQADYLVGYAVLPLAPAFFVRAGTRGSALLGGVALGGVLALVAMEVQLGVLAIALILLLAVLSSAVALRRRCVILLSAAAMLAAVESPTIVWAAHGISGLERLAQFGHGAAWLTANSLPPVLAVRLIGYLAQYDILSVGRWMGVWLPASWVVVVAAAAGMLALSGPMRWTLLIAATAALVIACGTTTPLAGVLTWAFERFPSAQVFRELYHVMALASLAYAVGVGAAFALAARLPYPHAWRGLLLAAVAIYVAPMLTGDVSGWLAAVPVDRYLAPAFHEENAGLGRVAWFPMDQPLAFDNRGSGVDPMSVTERGSLWLYSLAWPLTAVDASARGGDMNALQRDLRALGVAAVVERDRLHSRYRGLPGFADLAERFFGPDVRLGPTLGPAQDAGRSLRVFDIPSPLAAVRPAARYAVVPQRLAVIADAALAGAAVFDYAQSLPSRLPYEVYYDPGDRPWEALQVAGIAHPIASTRLDPLTGFAAGDLWWWLRPEYADVKRFALAIGRATKEIEAPDGTSGAVLVLAWIATPAGGRLAVRCGSGSAVVETGGWPAWRSAAVRCGTLRRGAAASVVAADPDAEVALRGAEIVDAAEYDRANTLLAGVVRGAARAVRLEDGAGRVRSLRAGRSRQLGQLVPGTRALVEVRRTGPTWPPATVRIEEAGGFALAWGRFDQGQRVLRLPLVAGAGPLRLRSEAPLAEWRLATFAQKERGAAKSGPGAPTPPRLLIDDQTFDGGWRADGAVAHLPSALGTNVFVLAQRGGGAPGIRFAYAPHYHVAYLFGAFILLVALAAGSRFAFAVQAPVGRP